jgi:aryl carrier-like protein
VSVQAIVVEEIIQLLGAEPVPHLGERAELRGCGLDSVRYLQLLLRLGERFGKDLFREDGPLPATVGELVKAFDSREWRGATRKAPARGDRGQVGYVLIRENHIIARSTRNAGNLPALWRSASTIFLPEKAVLNLSVNCV